MSTGEIQTKNLLFLGGLADGLRFDIPADMTTVEFEHDTSAANPNSNANPVDLYTRRTITGVGETFYLMCQTELSADDIIQLLITNYKGT